MWYRWLAPVDGRAFLGWMVTSIMGGALPFRPMLWLQAPGSSGKTFLVTDVMARVFGNLFTKSNDATPAGLAGKMQNNSLPFCLDEFEPEKGDEAKWTGILKVIRECTSGDMERLRGSAGNDMTISSQPRSSVFLASIYRPRLSRADDSRFFTIRFSQQKVAHWIKVRDGIEKATSADRMLALRTHIIVNTRAIAMKAREIESELLEFDANLDTREAMIIAALTAGRRRLST